MANATRRRLLAAGALVAARLLAEERKPRLAVLTVLPAAEAKPYLDAFYDGLRELGWLEGRNVTVDVRYTDGDPSRTSAASADLLALKPDVFVAATDLAAMAAATSSASPPSCSRLATIQWASVSSSRSAILAAGPPDCRVTTSS